MKESLEVKLIEMRTRNNITQEDLADHLGVTRQTIISIEKGRYKPSLILALKISKYFSVPLEDIFSLEK